MTLKHDGKQRFNDLELTPSILSSVPAGSNGQLAVVTGQGFRKLFVRESSVLVPAIQSHLGILNDDVIEMWVNPSTGQDPPAGTKVFTQADYTALGYKLKRPQNAIDILPPFSKGPVVIHLEAGEHLAGVNNTGYTGSSCMLAVGSGCDSLDGREWSMRSEMSYTNSIIFTGDSDTEVYAAEGGTTSGFVLTRTTGTWAVNELVGKFVYIVSGAGAGRKAVIESNTTNTLTVLYPFSPTGAVQFKVVTPAAVWLPSMTGSSQDVWDGLVLRHNKYLYFNNIAFGKTAMKCCYIKMQGISEGTSLAGTAFQLCQFIMEELYATSPLYIMSKTNFTECYINFNALRGIAVAWTIPMFQRCLIEGKASNYTQPLGGLISAIERAHVVLYYVTIRTLHPTNADVLIKCSNYSSVLLLTAVTLTGNGNSTGVLVMNDGDNNLSMTGTVTMNNCAKGFDISSNRAFLRGGAFVGNSIGVGWTLDRGATIFVSDLSTLGGTTNISLDGTTYAYTDIPNDGDTLIGTRRSQIIR
jgi:hypothetical protein